MPEDRRLVANMFTDIVGYTSLMGSDEDKAFRLLRKNRDLHRPLIKKYRGEWLKEMGDRALRKCPVDIFREGPACRGANYFGFGIADFGLRISNFFNNA